MRASLKLKLEIDARQKVQDLLKIECEDPTEVMTFYSDELSKCVSEFKSTVIEQTSAFVNKMRQ